ncbi:MAG: class I SAM-dependent methyltransferase [Gammaproteobacteria bacterium]|nr:class I SAM-dependent methyltransferase [Gammaproteobacteria bacterium]
MKTPQIGIYATKDRLKAEAERLSACLNLPLAKQKNEYDYQVIVTPEGLGLRKTGTKILPLTIDFLSGRMTYRRQHASLRNEILARALGLKKKSPVKIVDATAGLGRDSFILAALGFEIEMLERSPIVHVLLEDGLNRAKLDPVAAPIVERMKLHQANAIEWFQQVDPDHRPDIIYIDPMFPERSKSALAKKDMRIFHDIVGADSDAEQLLNRALACAKLRVVIKRPRLSGFLADLEPAFSHTGSSSRFDIYLPR